MTVFSQNDPRWKATQLGTSTTTLGSHGCTVTCLAMMANITPAEMNDRLKQVGGYQNGNLVIWSKVHDACSTLMHLEREKTYDNTKVAQTIQEHGGCLVEVNGAPIGGTTHWVLYIGNQKLIDPWDGITKSTSVYQPTGFSSVAVATKTEVVVDAETFEELVRKSSEFDRLTAEGYVMMNYHEAKMKEKQAEIDLLYSRIEEYEKHECPTVSEEQGWTINGKTVTVVSGNTTTTYNYKKES